MECRGRHEKLLKAMLAMLHNAERRVLVTRAQVCSTFSPLSLSLSLFLSYHSVNNYLAFRTSNLRYDAKHGTDRIESLHDGDTDLNGRG